MLPLLTENKDIVLVLEDAEKALVSRDVSEYTDVVQSILNLTDGLLGGALNVSIIATFNIDKQKIDTAFLRKGRLRVSYEFKKLDLNQTLNLAKKLNKDTSKITEGMTLADIYNIEEDPGYVKPETRRMGFV
jgi:SpoVK/Ycf46/Vps4 family AAA+-type ATPase